MLNLYAEVIIKCFIIILLFIIIIFNILLLMKKDCFKFKLM